MYEHQNGLKNRKAKDLDPGAAMEKIDQQFSQGSVVLEKLHNMAAGVAKLGGELRCVFLHPGDYNALVLWSLGTPRAFPHNDFEVSLGGRMIPIKVNTQGKPTPGVFRVDYV